MFKYSFIAFISFFSGCAQYPFLNGSFSITGEIVSHPNEICNLTVIENSLRFGRVAGNRSVSRTFEELIFVSEQTKEYRISVVCGNRELRRQIVVYPGTIGKGGTVDIGVL